MSERVALHEPRLDGNEWRYLKDCLDSGWVSTAGRYVELFEQGVAEYTGASFAISCINGSTALQLSLSLAGVRSGDEVIVPSLTFIASINAVHHNGASPIFMDADDYCNIDPNKCIEFIETETEFRDRYSWNRKTGKRISAIIPVHVFGNAARLDELVPVCKKRNIIVVEDAAESMGTRYCAGIFSGKHTGTIGRFGCLSFNGNKVMTCGGGGMILTNDSDLAAKARYLTTQAKDDSKDFVHNEAGYNYRLTNMQAAVGLAQLEQLPRILEDKRQHYLHYVKALESLPYYTMAEVPAYSENNHWINLLRHKDRLGKEKLDSLIGKCAAEGIEVRPIWRPNHLQRPYLRSQLFKIENAMRLVDSSLCLPSSPQLSRCQINRVIACLHG